MDCAFCAAEPATHRMLYDTANGRADNRLCLGCVAGRLVAYPPHGPNRAPDHTPTEVINMNTGSSIDEGEMEELIASREWPPYYMESQHCRKEKHGKCEPVRQPTNHIDPHPTVCVCTCHDDDNPDLAAVRARMAGVALEEDDEIIEWDDEDDDEVISWDDTDDDELVLDDEEDEFEFDDDD